MFYDYLIWGNWSPIYLWLVFFAVIGIYALHKYDYNIDNLSDKKFKMFLLFCIIFLGYYFLVYDPVAKPIQRILLSVTNVMPSFTVSVNAGPAFSFVFLLFAGVILYYLVKFATKKATSYLPKKS
jgi:hypothetical protein